MFERLPPPLNDRRPILPPLASRTAAADASRTGRFDIWPSLTMAVVRLASRYGRYGYRRVSAMLQWASDGKPVRLLTVVDEYTRECLAIHVGRSLRSPHVIECLEDLMVQRGVPERLRSDNGPEFTARAVRLWLQGVGATTLFITPGSPWENGYVESFDGKLRDELLDRELFDTLWGGAGPHRAVAPRVQPPTPPQRPGLSPSCSRGHPHLLCSKRYQCLMICGTTIGGRSRQRELGLTRHQLPLPESRASDFPIHSSTSRSEYHWFEFLNVGQSMLAEDLLARTFVRRPQGLALGCFYLEMA